MIIKLTQGKKSEKLGKDNNIEKKNIVLKYLSKF